MKAEIIQINNIANTKVSVDNLPPHLFETIYPFPDLWKWCDKLNNGCEPHIKYEVHYDGVLYEKDK